MRPTITRLAVMIGRAPARERVLSRHAKQGADLRRSRGRTAEYGTAHAGAPGHLDGPHLQQYERWSCALWDLVDRAARIGAYCLRHGQERC